MGDSRLQHTLYLLYLFSSNNRLGYIQVVYAVNGVYYLMAYFAQTWKSPIFVLFFFTKISYFCPIFSPNMSYNPTFLTSPITWRPVNVKVFVNNPADNPHFSNAAHSKEALDLSKMQESTVQMEHQRKYKVCMRFKWYITRVVPLNPSRLAIFKERSTWTRAHLAHKYKISGYWHH